MRVVPSTVISVVTSSVAPVFMTAPSFMTDPSLPDSITTALVSPATSNVPDTSVSSKISVGLSSRISTSDGLTTSCVGIEVGESCSVGARVGESCTDEIRGSIVGAGTLVVSSVVSVVVLQAIIRRMEVKVSAIVTNGR